LLLCLRGSLIQGAGELLSILLVRIYPSGYTRIYIPEPSTPHQPSSLRGHRRPSVPTGCGHEQRHLHAEHVLVVREEVEEVIERDFPVLIRVGHGANLPCPAPLLISASLRPSRPVEEGQASIPLVHRERELHQAHELLVREEASPALVRRLQARCNQGRGRKQEGLFLAYAYADVRLGLGIEYALD
jgi:hypothetical protein